MIQENVRLAQKFEAFVRSDNRWEAENLASIQDILSFNIKIYQLNIWSLWPKKSGLRFLQPDTCQCDSDDDHIVNGDDVDDNRDNHARLNDNSDDVDDNGLDWYTPIMIKNIANQWEIFQKVWKW